MFYIKEGKCTSIHLQVLYHFSPQSSSEAHKQSATQTQGEIYDAGNPGGTGCCRPKAVQNHHNLMMPFTRYIMNKLCNRKEAPNGCLHLQRTLRSCFCAVCECVCVCPCATNEDQNLHSTFKVRTFWSVLTTTEDCLRVKTWF